MFMMHFVGTPDGLEIFIIAVTKNLKSLMNENIMDEEIGKAIKRNTQSYPEKRIIPVLHSYIQTYNSRNCKDEEEEIIVFKKAFRLLFMVVLMEIPQKSVHDIFMHKPGDAFHKNECP
jgi:hypothetical protein